jgi:hypothetical protein
MRLLAYYSAFSLIFRESFRLASAAYFTYEQSYNSSQSYAICSNQLVILNSTVYDALSTSKYISFTSVGSFSEVFVMMAIQLHMSVMRTRGINQHIDQYISHSFCCFSHLLTPCSLLLDPFASSKKDVGSSLQLSISLSCLARLPVGCLLHCFLQELISRHGLQPKLVSVVLLRLFAPCSSYNCLPARFDGTAFRSPRAPSALFFLSGAAN